MTTTPHDPAEAERTSCSAPDPILHGWYPCALDVGHDGPHAATFTVHRFVPEPHSEQYRLQWELLDLTIGDQEHTP